MKFKYLRNLEMSDAILLLTRKAKRGGAIYEHDVLSALQSKYLTDTLYLDSSKNKGLVFNKFKHAYQVKKFRTEQQYNLLITNKEGIYADIHKKNISKKILIIHHYNEQENKYLLARSILKNKLRAALKQVDAIVVVADYWKKVIAKFTQPEKITVIQNSFDIDFIKTATENLNKEAFKKKYNIPANKILVYAGNALTVKGYKDVITQLDKKDYFIITSGSKDKNVSFHHLHLELGYKEYLQLLSVADITVILSKFPEGWNRIAHESLLCNTPVIGTDAGALGELLTKSNQVIYNEGDDLNKLIVEAISNKENLQKGKQYAMQFDKKYFSENWLRLVKAQLQ